MPKTKRIRPITGDIISVMEGRFAEWFPGDSWANWKTVLKAAHGLPLDESELPFFNEVAGGRAPPTKRVRQLWCVVGRRGGKNAITSLIAATAAAQFDGKRRQVGGITLPAMRKGERGTILLVANDREQAQVAFRYIESYFDELPELAAMVTRTTRDTIELANGCDIQVATNDFRSIRGRAVLLAIMDEVAFYRSETSASPDVEVYNAITPGMLTLKDQAMLVGISSAHKKAGLLYDRFRESYGKDDPDTLVIKATSLQLNPTLDANVIAAEIAADRDLKLAEYECVWREDISSLFQAELLDGAIVKGRAIMQPPDGAATVGFVDISGGVVDSHCAAVGFRDGNFSALASARELKTPDTESVVREFSEMLKSFGITRAFSDRYGAEWVRNAFARHGIELLKSPLTRSEIYANFAPMLNAGQVRLLDNQRLRSQLLALERRTTRGTGRDVIDHPTGGADDLANAACGALVMVARAAAMAPIGAVAVPIGNSTDWLPSNRDSLGYFPGEF
jgi:hypothetical protein